MRTAFQCAQCGLIAHSEHDAFKHLRTNHPDTFAAFYNVATPDEPLKYMLKGLRRVRQACLLARNEGSQTTRELLLDEAITGIDRIMEQ